MIKNKMKNAILAIAFILMAFTSTAQMFKNDTTARSYLASSTSFTQAQFNTYNTQPGMYQLKFPSDSTQSSAMILKYPSLDSVNVYWSNGVWNVDTATAITSNFNTLLMVSGISHTTSPQVPGLNTSTVTVSWNSIPGVTQYRFRIRPLNGPWNVSTITGTSRTMTTLTPNTTYEVVIRVYITSIIQGSYSEQVYQFTTPAAIPLPPCDPPSVSANIVGNQLQLSWISTQQGVSHQVQVRELGALSWGGTTVNTTTYNMVIDTNKAYEYQVRTNCTGAVTEKSLFSKTDTITKCTCKPPTGLYNVGNTFYWTNYQYGTLTQIQTRLIGTQTWANAGGTSTSTGSVQFKYLWGTHEWRLRTKCGYGTVKNNDWTNTWSYATTGFIPQPMLAKIEVETESAYPNPANDMVYLKGEIVIRDLQGRVVASGLDMIDVTNLVDGLYFINNQKLVIKH